MKEENINEEIHTPFEKMPSSINKWGDFDFSKTKFVVLEKIHGANFSFIYNVAKDEICCAKRKSILKENEDFFGYKNISGELKLKMKNMCKKILVEEQKVGAEVISITVFG